MPSRRSTAEAPLRVLAALGSGAAPSRLRGLLSTFRDPVQIVSVPPADMIVLVSEAPAEQLLFLIRQLRSDTRLTRAPLLALVPGITPALTNTLLDAGVDVVFSGLLPAALLRHTA